jgi:hypothetical protein
VVDENGKAKAVTATREEDDPHRDLWWAHTGGGGGNFGVATKFWFRSRDGQGDDPTLLLPKRPSGYTMASVAWRWAGLDEEKFTTLVNNYMRWCERNSSPGSPAASVFGNLVLFRQEFGVVTLTGQVDPGQPQSSEALDTYFAEVTANVPNGMKTIQDDAPWQYTRSMLRMYPTCWAYRRRNCVRRPKARSCDLHWMGHKSGRFSNA